MCDKLEENKRNSRCENIYYSTPGRLKIETKTSGVLFTKGEYKLIDRFKTLFETFTYREGPPTAHTLGR